MMKESLSYEIREKALKKKKELLVLNPEIGKISYISEQGDISKIEWFLVTFRSNDGKIGRRDSDKNKLEEPIVITFSRKKMLAISTDISCTRYFEGEMCILWKREGYDCLEGLFLEGAKNNYAAFRWNLQNMEIIDNNDKKRYMKFIKGIMFEFSECTGNMYLPLLMKGRNAIEQTQEE